MEMLGTGWLKCPPFSIQSILHYFRRGPNRVTNSSAKRENTQKFSSPHLLGLNKMVKMFQALRELS